MKRKILIASFLKQVNDIRSFEKIAKSLAKNNSYQIFCSGYPTNIELSDDAITLLPLKSFKKSAIYRILARWQVFIIYIKLKPELIIVNSPDLLFLTVLYRILFGGKIIYDIRENYFRNLWHQKNYSVPVRNILALLVRLKEQITSPLFDHFFLAENVYSQQLKFIRKSYTILENKSLYPEKTKTTHAAVKAPTFLISGTIALEYGVLEGIKLFKNIQKINLDSTLIIIGHCPNKWLYSKLELVAQNDTSIILKISRTPIAYEYIKTEILRTTFGLLPYLPNKSTQGKWPTKLYEYMTFKLPFLIQKNDLWNQFILENQAGLTFDFTNQNQEETQSIWSELNSRKFYTNTRLSKIYWSTQEKLLLTVVDKLLS